MEVTLYDGHGHPEAYIADDSSTIYLWSGHAVVYIDQGGLLYGWNGHHLGWFVGGVLYDTHGYRVGSIAAQCPYAVYAEPAKYAKYGQYAKYARYAAYARPAFSTGYGDQGLKEFLQSGSVTQDTVVR